MPKLQRSTKCNHKKIQLVRLAGWVILYKTRTDFTTVVTLYKIPSFNLVIVFSKRSIADTASSRSCFSLKHSEKKIIHININKLFTFSLSS